jgi:hypothetical protein
MLVYMLVADNTDNYRREYRIRRAIPGSRTVEVTFPYEVVEREARRHGISIEEFLKNFVAVAQFNGLNGVLYTFEPTKEVKD